MALDVYFVSDIKNALDAAALAGFDLDTLEHLAVSFGIKLDPECVKKGLAKSRTVDCRYVEKESVKNAEDDDPDSDIPEFNLENFLWRRDAGL